MSPPSPLLLILPLLLCVGNILCQSIIAISTPEELIELSFNVNNGIKNYTKTTVYLESDIDFTSDLSSQFEPIGINKTYNFKGTFNGQGHVIRNLIMSSSLQHIGLFGYSSGRTIENVVIDKSCSFESSYSDMSINSSDADIGSIIGRCDSYLIESIVNMANVTFTGNLSSNIFLGGIVGRFYSSCTVRNCVNYGSVIHFESVNTSFIGGLIGAYAGKGDGFINNCANYGTIVHGGISNELFLGGIAGANLGGGINGRNCISAGKLDNSTSANSNNYIGVIIGYVNKGSYTIISECLWTSDVGHRTACGHKNNDNPMLFNIFLTELNATRMNELNKNIKYDSRDKWFMLHLNGGKINNEVNQETLIVTQKYFPDPVKGDNTFLFWCTDARCTDKYDPNTTNITAITDLYAGWNSITITFDFGNGTKILKNATYGEKYGPLPIIKEREGYTFIGWFTENNGKGDKITENITVNIIYDHILYPHWTVNYYTLKFIFRNNENNLVRMLRYNGTIKYPEDPVREGYTFIGWDNNITTMPAHDLNIIARWEANNYIGYVEIIFKKKDLNDMEIRALIDKYTSKEYVIFKIGTDEKSRGTKVVIKFIGEEAVESFIKKIKSDSAVKSVGLYSSGPKSLTSSFCPSSLLYSVII